MFGEVETMTPATEERLRELVSFLNTMTDESVKLWWVLTALRGPDGGNYRQKHSTTAVIRHAIGLRDDVGNSAQVNHDSTEALAERTNEFGGDKDHHFKMHAKKAFNTLGLDWYSVNWSEVDNLDFDKI